MYEKVQAFLDLHSSDTASIPAVATLKNQLDSHVDEIHNLAIVVDADLSGHTVDKQARRSELKAAGLKVSTAVVAYAALNGINKLLEKCDESPSQMDYMRDNDFYTYCRTISTEATPIIANLADFGCLPADLSTLDTASQAFLEIIQDPRVQINERSNAANSLELEFDETDELLKSKLDKVMTVFISINPALYNAYKGARSIDDDGGGITAPDYDLSVAPNEILLIANLPYLAGREFKFKNTGSDKLLFGLSTNPDLLEGGTPVEVLAGETVQRLSSNLHSDEAANNLMVQNTSTSTQSFKVFINE